MKNCIICDAEFEIKTSRVCCSNECQREQAKRRFALRMQNPAKKKELLATKKRYKDKTRHIRNKYDCMHKQDKQCIICEKKFVGHFQSKTCSDVCRKTHNNNRSRRTRKKYLSIPKNDITARFRILFRRYLKDKGVYGSFRHLDYTGEELYNHLESQFTDGMSWDNRNNWHIDHIRPVSSFNYDSTEHPDFKKCWALNNLQPLWAEDNLKKGDEWDGIINV
jgi:predicted nucleic acid-binding Zn ribbon protein